MRVYSHVANVQYERGPATYTQQTQDVDYVYYSSVMNNCSLFVSPVIFLFHQGYIICPIVTHLL